MKSNQKGCSYRNKVKRRNMMGSVTSHSMENFTVFNKSALPKYCSDEPLLLVCDHTLANKRALLPMLKNNL